MPSCSATCGHADRFSDGAWSDPVAAIDVDKLSDHLLTEKILAARDARNGDIDAA
jgi:hypothetical protein